MNRPRRGLSPIFLLTFIGVLTIVSLLIYPPQTRRFESFSSLVSPHQQQQQRKSDAPEPVISSKQQSEDDDGRPRTTIVSAFFDLHKSGITSKHEPSFYLKTGREGVLSFQSPLIFFTDSPDAVRAARASSIFPGTADTTSRTVIVNISLHDFEVTKAHLNQMIELFPRDDEAVAASYSAPLFMIYHAKAEMMALASKLNPFQTDNFLWMDVGAVRDWGGISAKDYKHTRFPRPDREWVLGRQGKITLGAVAGSDGPCPDRVRWVEADTPHAVAKDPIKKMADPLDTLETPYLWWIAGAIWGGSGKDLVSYEQLYRKHLKRYLEKDKPKYSLIDQYIMGALACHSDMVEVVRPPRPCCVDRVNRKWFFLLMFFKDSTYPQTPYAQGEKSNRGSQPCQYCHLTP